MDQKRSEKIAEELLEPAEAAVKMQRLFKRAARELSSDYHLREDLVQEMSLAVLECGEPHPLLIFMNRAVCRAINFLEHWEHSKKRLEPLNRDDERFAYDPEEREVRRQAAIAELKRRKMGFLLKDIYQLEQAMAETPQAA